ncbi:MAG TPA: amidohydrolase family protein [Acidimicrobiales bacterium]
MGAGRSRSPGRADLPVELRADLRDGVDVVDARGLRVVPGFIDLQCNGGFGVDLATEPERLWEVAAALPATGVTAWLPTIISSPTEVRARALAALRSGPPGGGRGDGSGVRPGDRGAAPDGPDGPRPGATPLGLHLEGPLLSPERPGAHPAELLRRPGDEDVEVGAWSRASGVALVTLAPELPGALDVVRRLVDQGVVVSAGHSSATAAEAEAAVDAGVRWVTHLFNAMAPLHHREPGLAGVALADERLRVGMIADGVHVHPTALAAAARALGDRLTLVTDAVAALGLPPGPVRLGRAQAWADETSVRLADGTLAGSNLSLDRAIRTVAGLGVGARRSGPEGRPAADGPPGRPSADALAAAVRAASTTPAAVLGLTDRGVIAPGAVGDLVLLDDLGTVVATIVGGRVVYDRRRA